MVKVRWQIPMHRRSKSSNCDDSETVESFALRVSHSMAASLGIVSTSFTSQDAVEEAKRHLLEQQRLSAIESGIDGAGTRGFQARPARTITSAQLDSLTMRIKQAYPAVSLLTIRSDLERTRDARKTCERITSGMLREDSKEITTSYSEPELEPAPSVRSHPGVWRDLYMRRKWIMIETNRAKYLQKMNDKLSLMDVELSKSNEI
ncbi:hypothetical protein AB6A40_010983 [Gnathostoma spinigerum]|uniref:Uncharacterized protein n=1 Tax=Gnathostoma spinigerum TaxID=75299 RepID=A0ABD6F2L6_9BILA